MNRAQCDSIIEFVTKEVSSLGYRCIEAEWVASEKVLRLYLEDEKWQFDMEDCVKATKLLSENSELDALVSGSYTLEVSSPGVERPLRDLSDFRRYMGQSIEVKLNHAVDTRKHGKGKIVEVLPLSLSESDQGIDSGSDGFVITIETNRGQWKFPFAALQRANLVYDWGQSVKRSLLN